MKYTPKASAGDIAQCVNGHDLYRVTSEITAGAVMQSSQFEPIGDAPKPIYGEHIKPCHICGLPWIVPNPSNVGNIFGGYVMCSVKKRFER